MTRSLLLLTLVACGGGSDSAGTTPTGSGTPTGSAPRVTRCDLDDENSLLVHCTRDQAESGAPTLTLSGDGVPTRALTPDAPGTELALTAWALKPDTTYDWTWGDASGTVQTGSLPPAFAEAEISWSGAPVGYDAILMPMRCSVQYFVMLDGEGDVVWYVQEDLYLNGMDAYEWDPEARSVLVGKGNTLREHHVSGEQLWQLQDAWTGSLHHDLERWNGYTYILFDRLVNDLFVDGVHVFDGDTLVGTFDLADHYTVGGQGTGGPLGNDWSHANGIEATEDGHMILSLRHFDSVVSFDADPSSPTFLEIDWVAAGTDSGLPGADFQAPPDPGLGFGDQHNASWDGEHLMLFDNFGISQDSRAAKYRLDEAAGEVVLVDSWRVGEFCPIQGGAIPVDDGVLATCATSRSYMQFDSVSIEPIFEMHADCVGPLGPPGGEPLNRGIPIVF